MSLAGKNKTALTSLSLKFARPNRMNLRFSRGKETMQVVTDGKKQFVYDSNAKQYQELPAPKDISKAAAQAGGGISTISLLAGAKLDSFIKSAKLVGSESVGGVDSYVIEYTVPAKGMPGLVSKEKLWIGKKDGLVYQIVTTGTASAKAMAAHAKKGAKPPKGPLVITQKAITQNIAMNAAISPSTFKFSAPKGVTKFDPKAARADMQKRITAMEKKMDKTGDKAPAFGLVSLDGKQVTSADYTGKPLIAVFWSSMSKSAKDGIADMAKIQSTLRAKGVGLIAVTLDSNKAAAEKVVSDAGIGFPVLMGNDKAGEVGGKYGVMYMPTVFIIDGHGVIKGKVVSDAPSAGVIAELAKIGVK